MKVIYVHIHKVWLGQKEQKTQVLVTDKVNDSEEEINNLCPCLSVKFKYKIQKKIAYINRTIESWLQLRRLVVPSLPAPVCLLDKVPMC